MSDHMTFTCQEVSSRYQQKIQKIVNIQKEDRREAIFFIYEDGSTSDVFKGMPTQVTLTKNEQRKLLRNGNLFASVHSHPSGLEPSTIDIMTGLITQQEELCVAVPRFADGGGRSFALTCINFSDLNRLERRRLARAMRRTTVGFTDFGQELRKEFNIERFEITQCTINDQ